MPEESLTIIKGWTYILTYGKYLDIYARGSERVGVDRKTKRVVIIYSFQEAKEQKGVGGYPTGSLGRGAKYD